MSDSANDRDKRPDRSSSDRQPDAPKRSDGGSGKGYSKDRSSGSRDSAPRGDRPSYGDKPRSDRPSYGDKPRNERPSYGDKPRTGDRPSYGDKPRTGDRSSSGGKPRTGDRPAYGDKPRTGGRSPYSDKPRTGDRPSSGDKPRGERPSYGDKSRSERPSYGDKPRNERPTYGEKPTTGDRPSYGDKPRTGARPPYGDKPRGDRPSYGDKPRGDRPSYGDKPRGDRPSYGDKPRTGDRPAYGDKPRSGSDRSHSDRPRSDRPSYGDKPRSGGDRSHSDRPRTDRPHSDRPHSDRPARTGDKLWTRGGAPARGDRDAVREAEEMTEEQRMQRELRMVRSQHDDPDIPVSVTANDLDRVARNELKTLTTDNAERVARHLAMAAMLIDDDPALAHQHALSAARRAGRIGVVRETLAITAYEIGDYALALRELRTHRRITGSNDQLPLMVDSERGVGRPERALELGRTVDRATLAPGVRVALSIAMSGARLDLGQPELALAELQIPELNPDRAFEWSPELFGAQAEVLEELGRADEATVWRKRSDVAAAALSERSGDNESETIEVFEILEIEDDEGDEDAGVEDDGTNVGDEDAAVEDDGTDVDAEDVDGEHVDLDDPDADDEEPFDGAAAEQEK